MMTLEIVTPTRVDNIGNCHFEKTTVDRGEVKADSGFRGASPGPHQVNICPCIWYSVFRIERAYILRRRHFFIYHPSSSNITCCKVIARVMEWFHDPAGVIDFNKMSLNQSESRLLHESMIFLIFLLICSLILLYIIICLNSPPKLKTGTDENDVFILRILWTRQKQWI